MMPSADFVEQLKSDNELLQLQLQDLEYMIRLREEELDSLREAASLAVELQSRLDINLHEIAQMQQFIGSQQQQMEGVTKREANLETEMLQSVQTETAYYTIKEQFLSTQAALTDLHQQLADTTALYQQLSNLKSKVALLESSLAIAVLDNGFLKEELDLYRKEPSIHSSTAEKE